MRPTLFAATLVALVAAPVYGQGGKSLKFKDVVTSIKAKVEPATAKRGETVTWSLTLDVITGWHTYPTKQTDVNAESFVNKIDFPKPGNVVFVDKLNEPADPHKAPDKDLDIKELLTYEGKATWTRKFVVSPDAKPGKVTIKVPVTVLVCDKNCIQEKVNVEVELTISDAPAVAVDAKYAGEMPKAGGATPEPKQTAAPSKAAPPPLAADEPEEAASADQKAALASIVPILTNNAAPPSAGFGNFVWQAIFWGAVSLLTPCVFPMIPITVSIFLKKAEKSYANTLMHASVYCGTIVLVLGVAALTLLGTLRTISNSPITNYLLGVLMVVLALSLFGMFELTLPQSFTRFTSDRESKGGFVGTVFMALAFTTVSFTCVAPFLGGFAGIVNSGQYAPWQLAVGAFAFAATFAAPFFFLALFPSLLKSLPKSGGWLNSVKVVMGFLELAAAVKFFRAGEIMYSSEPSVFTYDLSMGMFVALSVLCGLYLVNVFRVGHDEPLESVSVPRLLAGFGFLSLGIYLLPAMFSVGNANERQRPTGSIYAWVDSFLLPEHTGTTGLVWNGDLKRSIDDTRREANRTGRDQFIFVDFTGKSCVNCKFNEHNVFSKPSTRDLFKPYKKLVQLYTDTVPDELYPAAVRDRFAGSLSKQTADALANKWFQAEAFRSEQLPLYVILKPTSEGKVEVVGMYDEGKINDVAAFEAFLRKPFEANTARASLN